MPQRLRALRSSCELRSARTAPQKDLLGPTISGVAIVSSTSAPSAGHAQPKVSAAALLPNGSAPGTGRFWCCERKRKYLVCRALQLQLDILDAHL
jgi:hypothetical protein